MLWAVLVVVTLHAVRAVPVRVDVTSDQRHSLSELGRRSVAALDRPLHARVYFSDGLEAPYHDHRRTLLDLLAELQRASSGRLQITVIDPSGDPEAVAAAARAGVQAVPYVSRAHDRSEARTIFMGVAFEYGERRASAPALPSLPRMEQELVRALRQAVTPTDARSSVGWVVGHGEPDPSSLPANSPLVALRDELGASHVLQAVELSRPLPDDLDALLLLAPRAALVPAEQLRIDQHVMGGGGLVAFLTGAQPDFERGQVVPVDHGLHALLARWGITVARQTVLDPVANERLAVPMRVPGAGARWVEVNHPLAPVTTRLDRTHPAVRDIPRLVLPFATPLRQSSLVPEGVRVDVWAESGPDSVAVSALPSLDPAASIAADAVAGPHRVVMAVSGRLPSAWTDRPVPPAAEVSSDSLRSSSRPARVVVAGSGDAAANTVELVVRSVDWVLQDPELLAVRATRGARPRLTIPDPSTLWGLRLAMLGGPLGLLGILTVVARRWGGA